MTGKGRLRKTTAMDIVEVAERAASPDAEWASEGAEECGVDTDREPDGTIRCADPATGEDEAMAFWLPDGVAVSDVLRDARAI